MYIFIEAKDPRDGGSVLLMCVSAEQALFTMAKLKREGLTEICAKDEWGEAISEDALKAVRE